MTNILMFEDDLELAEILSEFLSKYDIKTTIVDEPYIGLSTLSLNKFDLVILDLTLPGLDGLEVCKEIRKNNQIPIIISSARSDIDDKVNAFDYGADDYMPKPYNPKELLSRIKAILKRKNTKIQIEENVYKPFVLNEFEHDIKLNGKTLNLTSAEYEVLAHLIKKEGGAISREEIIYSCNSINEESTNKSIDVIISRIRLKIGENSKEPHFIHAIRGVGYKLINR